MFVLATRCCGEVGEFCQEVGGWGWRGEVNGSSI